MAIRFPFLLFLPHLRFCWLPISPLRPSFHVLSLILVPLFWLLLLFLFLFSFLCFPLPLVGCRHFGESGTNLPFAFPSASGIRPLRHPSGRPSWLKRPTCVRRFCRFLIHAWYATNTWSPSSHPRVVFLFSVRVTLSHSAHSLSLAHSRTPTVPLPLKLPSFTFSFTFAFAFFDVPPAPSSTCFLLLLNVMVSNALQVPSLAPACQPRRRWASART